MLSIFFYHKSIKVILDYSMLSLSSIIEVILDYSMLSFFFYHKSCNSSPSPALPLHDIASNFHVL